MKKSWTTLVITPEPAWPIVNGWNSRHYHLIRALAEFSEFDLVTLASPFAHVDPTETQLQLRARSLTVIRHSPPSKQMAALKSLFTSRPLGPVLFSSVAMRKAVAELSARNRYDACLILGDLCMARYVADVRARTHILDMCDDVAISYERRARIVGNGAARVYYRWQAKIIRSHLRKASLAFNQILAISELDATSISREVDVPVVTVPNCVDVARFWPAQLGVFVPHAPSLLFVGAMRAWSNRDAVRWFAFSVMPWILRENPEARLQVVGSGTEELKIDSPSVVVRGFAKNLEAEYRKCDVFICPLRVGTGIKNKLMEALASGCAIVSTDVGIEGLAIRHGEHLLVANEPIQFAQAVNRLLLEPELRTRLGKAARAFAEKSLSEGAVLNHLQAAILPSRM